MCFGNDILERWFVQTGCFELISILWIRSKNEFKNQQQYNATHFI